MIEVLPKPGATDVKEVYLQIMHHPKTIFKNPPDLLALCAGRFS